MTKDDLVLYLKQSVEWLQKEDEGCCTFKLDNRLAVCIGWSDGFDPNDDFVIHSKTSPTWGICAGIKVWTSDDMRTDFDWINMPYWTDGEVWDTSVTIGKNENYETLVDWFLGAYEAMSKYCITKKGEIQGERNDDDI